MTYADGKIYKIISPHTDRIYIGSTKEKYLCSRLKVHKYMNRVSKGCASRRIMDHGDHKIVLVEKYPCSNRAELIAREQYHLDLNVGICVNEIRACTGLTRVEYKAQHAAYMYHYHRTRGGDPRCHNNLLKVDIDLFK